MLSFAGKLRREFNTIYGIFKIGRINGNFGIIFTAFKSEIEHQASEINK